MLGAMVDQGMLLPHEDRVLGDHVALLRGKITVFDIRLWRRRRVWRTMWRSSSYSWYHRDTQLTVRNWLPQGKLQTRRSVAGIPLTPSHCRLRRQ
ncbi:hypothetical protein TNCV_3014811 [Trichonephila clavipes]|nr:hypothetical protein TNCV_3014811 [Trichonephila clavipes]